MVAVPPVTWTPPESTDERSPPTSEFQAYGPRTRSRGRSWVLETAHRLFPETFTGRHPRFHGSQSGTGSPGKNVPPPGAGVPVTDVATGNVNHETGELLSFNTA